MMSLSKVDGIQISNRDLAARKLFLPPFLSSNSVLCYVPDSDVWGLVFFLSIFKDDLAGKSTFKGPSAPFKVQTFNCGL